MAAGATVRRLGGETMGTDWSLAVAGGPADLYGARGQGRGLYVRDPDGHVVELRTYP